MLDPDQQLQLGDLGGQAGLAKLQGAMGQAGQTGEATLPRDADGKKKRQPKKKKGKEETDPNDVKEARRMDHRLISDMRFRLDINPSPRNMPQKLGSSAGGA